MTRNTLQMSSRALIDELTYVFLNGKTGISLRLEGIDGPELTQFFSYIRRNPDINIGKRGMAPMFAGGLKQQIEHEYSAIASIVKSSDLDSMSDQDLKSLKSKITQMIDLLSDLTLVGQKTLYH